METFDLVVDEKIIVWRRSFVSVEAETLGEAANKCINEGSSAGEITDVDYLAETEEYVNKDDRDNPITIEVMDVHYNTLATDENL